SALSRLASSLLLCLFRFLLIRPPSRSTLFPYTTLFRSIAYEEIEVHGVADRVRLQQAAEVCRKLGISEANTICDKLPLPAASERSEEHTSELQSRENLVCRLRLEKKKSKRRLKHHYRQQ